MFAPLGSDRARRWPHCRGWDKLKPRRGAGVEGKGIKSANFRHSDIMEPAERSDRAMETLEAQCFPSLARPLRPLRPLRIRKYRS